MAKFDLYVNDNYHYGSEEDSGPEKSFNTYEEAIAAAKRIIDGYLTELDYRGMTEEELFSGWTHYGESPYIISSDKQYIEDLKARANAAAAEMERLVEIHGNLGYIELLKYTSPPDTNHFSASAYARQRCKELCTKPDTNSQEEGDQ